ncbi:hypothetical protein ERX27_05830 [Macrococcus brunensis]|uniref:Polymer-forming cytoskeletal protein n=1 Tax=Macrococcus brunensis TaxID=198483 RepID=A0A4R6BE06_9STAP|nr:hypothetical protein [Macrococcus brunensis]TDL97979.1 hypothetical protein ERX27_05830 [Macrococcus brunensis]ULG71761.1 hypothetical protein MGG12_10785 [Macrococcus brunensis]
MTVERQDGGIFETIHLDQSVTYASSVEANEIDVQSGSVVIEGRLNAPYLSNAGGLEVTSTLETNELANKKEAHLKVADNVVAQTVNNAGTLELGHHFKAETIESTGKLVAAGTIEATSVRLSGFIQLHDIRAERLDITVTHNSSADYLAASDIRIKAQREALIFKDDDHSLKVNEIDGGEVYLENVIAELVRGDRVTIGPNCTIKVVEYTEDYKLDEQSDVLELGKITRD